MKNYLRLFFLLMLVGCMTLPEPAKIQKQDPRLAQSHLEMSFEDLSQVGHLILRAFDKEENTCSLPKNKIFAAPQIYRSFLDEKYSEVQTEYLKKSLKNKVVFWSPKCADTCSCDVYIGFSEYLQAFNFLLSSTELKAVEKLKVLQGNERSRIGACLNQAQWVCESRFLKEILKRID
jgi:hypothetical protein